MPDILYNPNSRIAKDCRPAIKCEYKNYITITMTSLYLPIHSDG